MNNFSLNLEVRVPLRLAPHCLFSVLMAGDDVSLILFFSTQFIMSLTVFLTVSSILSVM